MVRIDIMCNRDVSFLLWSRLESVKKICFLRVAHSLVVSGCRNASADVFPETNVLESLWRFFSLCCMAVFTAPMCYPEGPLEDAESVIFITL